MACFQQEAPNPCSYEQYFNLLCIWYACIGKYMPHTSYYTSERKKIQNKKQGKEHQSPNYSLTDRKNNKRFSRWHHMYGVKQIYVRIWYVITFYLQFTEETLSLHS